MSDLLKPKTDVFSTAGTTSKTISSTLTARCQSAHGGN